MARPKGQPKLGGRAKGTPNKTTAEIREMVIQALDRAGGVDYLIKQADKTPKAFMALLSKLLPTQVTGEDGGAVQVQLMESILRGRKRVESGDSQ